MLRFHGGAWLVFLAACSSSTPTQAPSGGAGGAGAGSGGASGSGSGGAAPANGSGGSGSGGAPVGSAPAVDAGTGGAVVDAAVIVDQAGADVASPSCASGALLCEDFEGYAVGPSLAPTWMTDNMGGTLQVDTTRPFAGTKSVHFTATANAANLLQIWKQGAPLFPIKNNTFYGRVMMWLSRQPTGGVHFNTVQANGMLPGSTQIAKYAYGAMYEKLMAGYTVRATEADLPTVDCGKSTGTTGYPVGKWVCAEWEFNGANDEMHYWLDSVAQTAVDLVKTDPSCGMTPPPGNEWKAPTFNKLMLGWYSQAYAMPVELWMDDVVISTERVGCPKAP